MSMGQFEHDRSSRLSTRRALSRLGGRSGARALCGVLALLGVACEPGGTPAVDTGATDVAAGTLVRNPQSPVPGGESPVPAGDTALSSGVGSLRGSIDSALAATRRRTRP